jgi:hypothetical protein
MKVRVLLEQANDQSAVASAYVDDCLDLMPREVAEEGDPRLCARLHGAIEHRPKLRSSREPFPPARPRCALEHVLAARHSWERLGKRAVHTAVHDRELVPP